MNATDPEKRNNQLRQARRRRMLTIKETAKLVKVSPITYSRWELGTQKPRLASLKDLCDAFEMPAEKLGFGDLLKE
ncbi:MAG TPA: helix-turn-helix transcriptional regulator [Ktedonobacteraceae bacterium]|nr:helix-turn-helix transcriptional regulator [Ktedonobacteraceae bacterium]